MSKDTIIVVSFISAVVVLILVGGFNPFAAMGIITLSAALILFMLA